MSVTELDPGYIYDLSINDGTDNNNQRIWFKKTEPGEPGEPVTTVVFGVEEDDVLLMLIHRAKYMNTNWPVGPGCLEYEHHLKKAMESLLLRREDRAKRDMTGKFGA